MKPKEIAFHRPVKVFQLFKLVNIYSKEEKSFDDRKERLLWTTELSSSGYVKDNVLFLNENIVDDPDLKNCNLITMEEHKSINYRNYEDPPQNRCLNLHHKAIIDEFEIWNKDPLELHIAPSGILETPKRAEGFKLCNIVKGQAIEVKHNYKIDSTLSKGTRRIFVEQRSIIEYMGEFEHCFLLKHPITPIQKNIPTNTKLIDLIKPLW